MMVQKENQIVNSKYFNIIYKENDSNIIEQIINLIDTTYEKITKIFKLNHDNNKFTLYVCSDVEEFKKQTGKTDNEYQEWMVGNANYTDKKLCILSPNVVRDRSLEDMFKIFKHEVIHIALGQLETPDNVNIFIVEGIAVAFAEQINVSGLELDNFPSANKLIDKNYFYENKGYLYSGVYVLYILKKYGFDVFKKIYKNEVRLDDYLYDGFENDAIQSLLTDFKIKK